MSHTYIFSSSTPQLSAKSKNELLHERTTPTIRTLWKQNGIAETKIEDGEKILYIQENAFDWIAPTIFISTGLLSLNPHIISVALGVISNYPTDWFRGIPESKKVKIYIVVETMSGVYKRVRYEGFQMLFVR